MPRGVEKCKLWHLVKVRTSGWVKGNKPQFTKDYCHPFNPGHPWLEYDEATLSLYRKGRDAFRTLVENNKFCMPSCLLFEQERVEKATLIRSLDKRGAEAYAAWKREFASS